MTFSLRPYQQRACDAAIDWLRSSLDPCLIDAAPAAGKSHCIAYIANALYEMSGGKRVLCLAPAATLVRQNYEKFLLTGEPASIFSASAGRKETRHKIVYATPGTVKNSISRFTKGFCAVIVDECHGMTPTILEIIGAMRAANPNLRVMGLSGTPFALGKGYIFRQWPDGRVNGDDQCRDPFFMRCVYRVTAKEMLQERFITPMEIGSIHSGSYDTSGIKLLPNGTLDQVTVERAFVGRGRLTAKVCADVVAQSQGRYGGVMLFGATVQHCQEILESMPPMNSAIVTGTVNQMCGRDCDEKTIIQAYRDQKFKYLISCGKLTTGFDVGHTSIIAILRYSESAALITQILGRAWRLDALKSSSLLLDYSNIVETHFPDGDIYTPSIRVSGVGGGEGSVSAECPDCAYENDFSKRGDCADYRLDKHGYCLDVFGEQVVTPHGPMPGHYGRRCVGLVKTGNMGQYERCSYYFTSKECPQCFHKNDIAARFCKDCKTELCDPNEKLISDFRAMKKDPSQVQTDIVVAVDFKPGVSQKGNKTIRADWITPHRRMSTWHMPESSHSKGMRDWSLFAQYTDGGNSAPNTITYIKEESGLYRILAFDRLPDEEPVAA